MLKTCYFALLILFGRRKGYNFNIVQFQLSVRTVNFWTVHSITIIKYSLYIDMLYIFDHVLEHLFKKASHIICPKWITHMLNGELFLIDFINVFGLEEFLYLMAGDLSYIIWRHNVNN